MDLKIIHLFKYICSIILLVFSAGEIVAFNTSVYSATSNLKSGKWVKVKVEKDGIYRITQSDIAKWGFSNIENIRVYGYGGAPISDVLRESSYIDDLPLTPVIRTSAGILFYGKSHESWNQIAQSGLMYRQEQHPYSQYGCYFITENDASEITYEKPNAELYGTDPISTFTERTFHENELSSPGMTGRYLLGEDFRYSTTQSFKFTLTDIVPESKVYVLTAFAAKVMQGTSSLTFQYNGTNLSKTSTDDIRAVTSAAYEHVKYTETIKSFPLSDANLAYSINFTYSGTLFVAKLDHITINYTRNLSLNSNELLFRGAGSNDYKIAGATENTRVLDITSPNKPIEMAVSINGNVASFAARNSGNREFIAFNSNATYPAPTLVEAVANQDLHSTEVPNMVIITPPEFQAQAQRIAEMHTKNDGMSVAVVTPQLIYNEFSSGTPDINAYRRLLKMYWDRGNSSTESNKLGYVLLFGRSSYDNRQITDKVKKATYPMLLNWQSLSGDNENSSYNTDDILAFLNDNSGQNMASDKLCIAVGRMPVKSVTEARQATDKLISYTSNTNKGTWKNNLLIIGDDDDNAIHMKQSEAVIKLLKEYGGSKYIYNHVYTDAFTAVSSGGGRSYPDARNKMFQKFSEGMLWVNYVGHANPVSWTHDGLLNISDINNQFYYKNYPLLYTATCEFTRWDSDDVSGGEIVYLNPQGGVIALITASRVVYIADNGVLNSFVSRFVFSKDENGNHLRTGDILKNGKNLYSVSNDNKLKYMLIGDPAMRLNYPSYTVKLETINGEAVNDENQPTIKARSTTEIAGTILNSKGEKAEEYNGVLTTSLYDAEVSVETNGYGENGEKYIYYDRANKLYIAADSIKNGAFKITINMPAEISNNYSPALFNFYADGKDGDIAVEANGASENLYVYGYDESATEDNEGPEIESIYLNSESFKNGDTVNESPMLFATFNDKSGINISTSGIGHQMSILVDNATTYDDVAQYYSPAIDNALKGSIAYPVSELSEGKHTLRFRVWDTANNSSENTIEFNVQKGLAPQIFDIYTPSNPASVEANFYIKHNRPDALITVKVSVFNLLGNEIWSSTQTGKSDNFTSFPITWNLCNNAGCRVSRGIYLYRATISTDGVQESTKSKKIAVCAE
ncbi:MAG: type IX secretion system sortase PorU [Muribaculaceae bacterium]|nr:type IX secretion system sortase PorU [Muribaculaceae bacterium]